MGDVARVTFPSFQRDVNPEKQNVNELVLSGRWKGIALVHTLEHPWVLYPKTATAAQPL